MSRQRNVEAVRALAPAPAEVFERGNLCPSCGTSNLARVPLCEVCGSKLTAPEPVRETDALWYGRELERHAKRAGDACARFERAREALEGLARAWTERATAERARARDVIPFGGNAGEMTETDAACLDAHSAGLDTAADELRAALAGL